MTGRNAPRLSWFDDIGRLRLAGYLEGTTLVTLLFVAVPFKHLAGYGGLVSVVGPVHRAVFRLCRIGRVRAQFQMARDSAHRHCRAAAVRDVRQ